MKRVLILVLISSALTSCDFLFPSINRTWKVTKLADVGKRSKTTEARYLDGFFSFYPDGKYSYLKITEPGQEETTREINKRTYKPSIQYNSGSWAKSGEELTLQPESSGKKTTLSIQEMDNKWLILKVLNDPYNLKGITLKSQPSDIYRSEYFDLLHPDNNLWRTRPTEKENDEKIKARVLQHVNYALKYFKMVEDKKQGFFQPIVLSTPLQFYANGLGLNHNFEQKALWLSYFYDIEDAEKAGKILSQGIRSIQSYPKDEKSYTKGYYKALVMVRDHIEK